ncbi:MAG: NUDIX hydrolase [Chloroflexi bacterium]|nr:NUDIX hydrolase [Chloroflexota bacterium]
MSKRQLAVWLQKAPWTVALARQVWRLGQPKFSAGAVGVVFNEAGCVLLVEHVFHPYAPWGLPGGWVDRHESPAETVRRELHEELGLVVEVGPVLVAETNYPNHLDLAYLCYATGVIGRLSRELLAWEWYNINALPKLQPFHALAITRAIAFRSQTS